MTRAQRRTLGALGLLIVVVAVGLMVWRPAGGNGATALGVLAGNDATDDDDRSLTTETTLPLVPVTGGAPLAPAPPPPTTVPKLTAEQIAAARPPAEVGSASVAAAGPPVASASPVLDGTGALLSRPPTDEIRKVDKAKGCRSANDRGWTIDDCGALKRDDGVLLWVVESRGKARRAFVLRERTAGEWTTMLRAADDDGSRWSSIGVRGADVSGDGKPDLVFGFHGRDPAKTLGVDVVDGPGTVGLHLGLAGGGARSGSGGLEAWTRLADGSYDTATYKVLAGGWRVASSGRLPAGGAPASMV